MAKAKTIIGVSGLSALLLCGTGATVNAQSPVPGFAPPISSSKPSDDLIKGTVRHQVIPADQLLSQGKYSDAEEVYRQQLVNNPQDMQATVGLGMALAKQFKLDGAEDLFARVLAQDPNNAMAHAGKAIVALNRLQSSSGTIRDQKDSILRYAQDEARMATQLGPSVAEAHYALGSVLREQGKTDDAVSEFKTAITLDPAHSYAYAGLGKIYLEQGSTAQAGENFRRSIELNSGNSTAHYGYGAALLQQGLVDEAIKELNTSLYQFPNSAPVRLALGQAYEKQGNNNAALKEYQLSILIKPENPDPYLRIANIREQNGDLEVSLVDLRNALGQLPYNLELRMRIADTLVKLEKADDAIKAYKTILSMSPNNPQAVKGLTQSLYIKAQKAAAGAMLASNDYESALKTLDEAMKLNPDDMELRLAEAKLKSLSGTKPDLTVLGEPKNDGERIGLAEALMLQGDFQRASSLVADVITRLNDPKQAFAVADLAVMIHDLDNAQAAYLKAQSMTGNPDRVARGLAEIDRQRKQAAEDVKVAAELIKKNQVGGASERFRHAIIVNPRLPEARLGLAQTIEKTPKPSSLLLKEASKQYMDYLSLKGDLPEKDKQKLKKQADNLNQKAAKLAQKGV